MSYTFVEYANKVFLEYCLNLDTPTIKNKNFLEVGNECKYDSYDSSVNLHSVGDGEDLIDFCNSYRKDNSCLFDYVFMSRVFEHLPFRKVDFYLYMLYTCMKKDAILHVVVPDMKKCSLMIEQEYEKPVPDLFLINRLSCELLSEGDDLLWRHSLWSSEASLSYYLQKEKLFRIASIEYITIDSSIVPPQIVMKAYRS